jgi:hypothetical protein
MITEIGNQGERMPRGGKRPGAGRPKLRAGERLSKFIRARMNPEELASCERSAKRAGMALNDWTRETLLGRADREEGRKA